MGTALPNIAFADEASSSRELAWRRQLICPAVMGKRSRMRRAKGGLRLSDEDDRRRQRAGEALRCWARRRGNEDGDALVHSLWGIQHGEMSGAADDFDLRSRHIVSHQLKPGRAGSRLQGDPDLLGINIRALQYQ